jgi:hypothetical protein
MPDIRFIGDAHWDELFDPAFSCDSWGVDHARWQFSGRVDEQKAFEENLKKFQAMPGFGTMRLSAWSTQEHRSFPVMALDYVGLKNGQIPVVRARDSVVLQTAQVTASTAGGTVSGAFTYRASRTTWSWCEISAPPNYSKYNTVRRGVSPFSSIEGFKAADGQGKNKTIPYSTFVALLNSLRLELVVSNYEVEDVIPDTLWTCTADVDYRFASS